MNLETFLVEFQQKMYNNVKSKVARFSGIKCPDLTDVRTGSARRKRWSAPATEAWTPDQQEQLWMNIKTIILGVLG